MNPITLQPGQLSMMLGPGILQIEFDPPGAGTGRGYYEIHYYDQDGFVNEIVGGQITSRFYFEYNMRHRYRFKVKNIGLNYPIRFR
ncbi:hypothetical protein DBR11_05870 [Pedobacter sp. HMWF019]|uniref:hypothetical protein n=1 Tax=Pedobacter sp. HMWF019 TaxID=2056856 RepID=UPI000D3AF760|nr:hypothetical protein [Pedobacter sp. HMWF019]PTT02069.1 hypothetical protein DBR11_05870 [Pedobacter sp. HMWF019]